MQFLHVLKSFLLSLQFLHIIRLILYLHDINLSSNIIPQSIYYQIDIDMLTMNTKTNVLAIVASIAILTAIGSVTDIFAHTPNTLPYGAVGQEDQNYFYHDGVLYVNAVPTQGNGLFISESDIDNDYSIDQAIERFGIQEDVTSFEVQPSMYSDVVVTYELDEDLQFQIVSIQ